MSHSQKVWKSPYEEGQGHDDPVRGDWNPFPERKQITHANGDPRKREHQGNHKVERIFPRYFGSGDQIGGRQPESHSKQKGNSAEEK